MDYKGEVGQTSLKQPEFQTFVISLFKDCRKIKVSLFCRFPGINIFLGQGTFLNISQVCSEKHLVLDKNVVLLWAAHRHGGTIIYFCLLCD